MSDPDTRRRIFVEGPHPYRPLSRMWCQTCLWQTTDGTAETARGHVTDTGHTVFHDYVIRTTFRKAAP